MDDWEAMGCSMWGALAPGQASESCRDLCFTNAKLGEEADLCRNKSELIFAECDAEPLIMYRNLQQSPVRTRCRAEHASQSASTADCLLFILIFLSSHGALLTKIFALGPRQIMLTAALLFVFVPPTVAAHSMGASQDDLSEHNSGATIFSTAPEAQLIALTNGVGSFDPGTISGLEHISEFQLFTLRECAAHADCAGVEYCDAAESCWANHLCCTYTDSIDGACPGCCTVADCDDGNKCTDDSCQSHTCVHASNAQSCDDGNASLTHFHA